MNMYLTRVEALRKQLPENADGALVTSQVNRFYLTGYNADTGFLLISRSGMCFITDSRYTEAARKALYGVCDVAIYSKLSDTLFSLAEHLGISTVLLEGERLTIAEGNRLAKAFLPKKALASAQLDMILSSLRVSKSAEELDAVRAAQAVAEKSLCHVCGMIKEGVTERELALELEFDMRRRGAQCVSFPLIVAAGANSSMPHAVPSDYRVKKGDFITFDIGAVYNGYCSDMTRTFSLGRVSSEQRKVYDTVLRAHNAGLEYLHSGGRSCFEADKAARDIIAAEGYGKCFGHSLGHGVGIEIHEQPGLSPAATGEIPVGSIVTVEPGIYIEGRFGVRIEDMVYVGSEGIIDLANMEKELVEL